MGAREGPINGFIPGPYLGCDRDHTIPCLSLRRIVTNFTTHRYLHHRQTCEFKRIYREVKGCLL